MSERQPGQSWMPGDVYFGDTETPLPDWRAEGSESDRDDDAPLSDEERAAMVRMLGFDPADLEWEDVPFVPMSIDEHGREHKGRGAGGGQFVKGSGGGDSSKKKKKDKKEKEREWDGVIDPHQVSRRTDSEHVTSWDFYDDEGNHFPQTVDIEIAEYDTDPDGDDPDSIIEVYRWTSYDDGGTNKRGEWTTDRQEAIDGGEEYARDNNQEEPEEDEPEEEDEDEDEPDEEHAEVVKHYLDGDEDTAAYVVGAPSDATVSVNVDPDDFSVEVHIRHPSIHTCRRTLDTDKHGNKFIHNDILEIKKGKQGGGFASDLFTREARQAAESGYAYIETHAAGNWSRRQSWNGYYTWPCLGYDQSLDDLAAQDSDGRECVEKVREILPAAESVLDVIQAGELQLDERDAQEIRVSLAQLDKELGRPPRDRTKITGLMWWQVHGEGMEHAKFDLEEGSRSWEQNEAYRASKKK